VRLTILCASLALVRGSSAWSQAAPVVDYHQHLFSPAAAALVTAAPGGGISARDVIALLDSAGIRRALVLSVAYTWASANRSVDNEYEKVKAENDWTSQQVAQYPDRLRGFCSFNPLKDYALDELTRCTKDPQLHFGLKLHFGNSDVDYHNAQQIAQVRRVFAAANEHNMAIVVHMHASINKKRAYGAEEARVFLNELLPAAPNVPVQIAHLAGAGGYDEPAVDQALGVFADAITAHDPRVQRLWFDVTQVVTRDITPDQAKRMAARIRQVGVDRVLYGSDATAGGNLAPRQAWAAFRQIPLSDAEFRTIANNITPYMR
jgi:predicted TIM-barrel fold metal-dependent hydrolase